MGAVARMALAVALTAMTLMTVGGLARSLVVGHELPRPVPDVMRQGNRELLAGRWAGAAREYRTAVTINPLEKNAWFYLGLALASGSDRAGLVEAHAAARRTVPASAAALLDGARAADAWARMSPEERARTLEGK